MKRSYRLTVAEVLAETAEANTIVFEVPEADRESFAHRPGQFITVHIQLSEQESMARSYSFSNPAGAQQPQVTVKRMGPGSEWMCGLRPGDELEVLPPGGVFCPPDLDEDIVLCAAGSGITPVHSILRTVLEQGNGRVLLVYANPSPEQTIFGPALDELAAEHERFELINWHESTHGLPDAGSLGGLLRPHHGKRLFYCGPDGFMRVMRETVEALEWPSESVHVEQYVSLRGNPFAKRAPQERTARLRVNLDGEQHEYSWPESARMLDVLLENGLDAPYSCREGKCSTCACRLVSGDVKMAHNEVLEEEDFEEGLILACQSHPITDEVEIRYD